MRKKQLFFRAAGLLLCLIIALNCAAVPVFAYTQIDIGQEVSLKIKHPCVEAEFRMYRIAEVSSYGQYSLTEEFANYNISLDPSDQSGWRVLAETLSGYAARDMHSPVREGKTDDAGELVFSGLSVGLYLVVSDRCERGDVYYVSEPLLIALPNLDADDCWVYDVSAEPKYGTEPAFDPVELRVIKVWKDGESSQRPAAITAQLLRDGVVWDSVELSDGNNWRHTWSGLDDRNTWQIVEEKVPQGYTVAVQKEGNTVILTNTRPGDPDKPPLPQTGVLWWPVGVLTAAVILLLLVGCIRRKNQNA